MQELASAMSQSLSPEAAVAVVVAAIAVLWAVIIGYFVIEGSGFIERSRNRHAVLGSVFSQQADPYSDSAIDAVSKALSVDRRKAAELIARHEADAMAREW